MLQGRNPFTVLGHGGMDQVSMMRRVNFLQRILAPQRFRRRRNDGDHIDVRASGARFGDDFPQDDFRTGTPDVDLDIGPIRAVMPRERRVLREAGQGRCRRSQGQDPTTHVLYPVHVLSSLRERPGGPLRLALH